MSNWEVTDKKIYQLLKHPYQVDKSVVEDMTSAYLEFVEELKSPFYLNPEVVNSTDVMEIVSGFFNTENAIQRIDHKEVFLVISLILSASSSTWTLGISIKRDLC